MKRIMAIRTEDREYAEELAKNLNRSDEVIFQILIFTEKNAYEDYIKENTNFEERQKTQLWRIKIDFFISYSNAFKE